MTEKDFAAQKNFAAARRMDTTSLRSVEYNTGPSGACLEYDVFVLHM
jgi:hypothetical protein